MNELYWNAQLLNDRNTLWLKRPASRTKEEWMTALPLGNGYTGALFFGAAGADVLRLTRYDLWAGASCTGALPDLSGALQEMRDKMDRNDWPSANFDMMHTLHASDYRQTIANPFPLGQMNLTAVDVEQPFSHYRRGLQMTDAEAFARWHYGEARSLRRCFVSQADGAVWFSIEEDHPRTLELTLTPTTQVTQHPLLEEIKNNAETRIENNRILFTTQVEGKSIGIAAQVLPHPGSVVEKCDGYLLLKGRNFTVKLYTFTLENDEVVQEFFESHCKNAALCTGSEYEKAFLAHKECWTSRFEEVALTLEEDPFACTQSNEALLDEAYEEYASPALLEKLWRFARYLFMSGVAADAGVFALYGLWYGEFGLPWTQNVANENVQMLYSGAAVGGHFDALRSLIHFYAGQMEAYRKNARQLFGCRGIWVPAYTAPKGLNGVASDGPAVSVPVILNWISAAGWLSSVFYNYYRYTDDKALLEHDILPFMIETARFYADYVRFDANGICRIYPSVSPENTPGNLMPAHFSEDMGHICPAVENATMDFAIMKETLQNLLTVLREENCAASVEESELVQWQHILEHIPDYAIDETTGGAKEWIHPLLAEHPYHRHVSQMYPVFPGYEIRRDNAPALLKAFEIATQNRILGSKSGWAFAHLAALYCRLGDGEQALQELDLMSKACLLENFFTLHNDWRHMGASMDLGSVSPMQLDALMGAANALQEMIVYPAPDVLCLLPAMPQRLVKGNAKGLYLPWGRMDLIWNATTAQAVLYPNKDAVLTLYFPDGTQRRITLQKDSAFSIQFER